MSRNATTASSSYSMSAGVWRSMMRQNTQSVTAPPRRPAIIPACRAAATPEGAPDGNVSEVQAQDPEERRSEEHTSELQSRLHLVCRLLLEKKKRTERTDQRNIDDGLDRVPHSAR